ncbi:MAG TPA: carboxypeptidase-like regulatory domain-containing protein [Acidimicrobiales bacterium]|nr:carboxypeptidase-like regulatory domain-containing protein [Acidimicrobiales bacterium]
MTPTPRAAALAVVLLVAVGLLAGCTAPPENTAVVHGVLERPMLSDFPVRNRQPLPAAGVVLAAHDSKVVATVSVGTNGRFSLRLPPGNYTLYARVAGFPRGTTCQAAHVVQAKADQAVSADVFCRYPLATVG